MNLLNLLQSATCRIQINGLTKDLTLNKIFREKEYYIEYRQESLDKTSFKTELNLHVKEELTLNWVEISIDLSQLELQAMLCNGFQTWSGSKYYKPSEKIPRINKLARPLFKYYGDYYLNNSYINDQYLHSWTFTSLQFKNNYQEIILGANNDQLAFTLFAYCKRTKRLIITKELKDFSIKNSFNLFNFTIGTNAGITPFKQWSNESLYPKKNFDLEIDSAWTSWYKYQQNISAEILHKELDALESNKSPELFQIDDGYQKRIGDWLDFKEDLKTELKPICNKIKQKGMIAGIWLAPFVVEPSSAIYKNHPDWISKDSSGKPIKLGYNGVWKCWYYGLDIYKAEVQNYLLKVFHVLKNEFGFELFKVDFLFAACINPPKGVSKAQAMTFGMEFLYRATNGASLLSCGVPLASSFGIADISRIGPDTHLQWDFTLLKNIGKRERPSNFLALHTIINRYILKAFTALDPDVYILRANNREEGLKLNHEQKRTHVFVANLFGDVQFTSDTVAKYDGEQKKLLEETEPFKNATIQNVKRLQNDCYRVITDIATLFINLDDHTKKISFKGNLSTLEAYKTNVYYINQ